MLKPHPTQRFVLTFVVAALSLSVATAALADTIYLKNGRQIRSSHVRIEGDKVYFIQYGGEVALPMSLVDRIEEDANVEPPPSPPRATPVEGTAPAEGAPAAGGGAEGAEGAEGETPIEQTQEYWQDRVRAIEAEKEQVRLNIEDLRRTERAFLFSHRSTAETRQQIEAAEARLVELDQEMVELQAEARRAGVPAGWLRLPPGGGVGGESGGATGSGDSGS